MLLDLLLLAACGGIYSVPLYAVMQECSAKAELARMIAANNVVNAAAIVAGAAITAGLAMAGVAPATVLIIAAAANLLVAVWIVRILPQEHAARSVSLVFQDIPRRDCHRARASAGSRSPHRLRREPSELPRWVLRRCLPAGNADVRRQHPHCPALVGAPVAGRCPLLRRRSSQPVQHQDDGPRREGRREAGGVPRRTADDHRLVDEGLRGRGHDRRPCCGACRAGPDRRAAVHQVDAPGRPGRRIAGSRRCR